MKEFSLMLAAIVVIGTGSFFLRKPTIMRSVAHGPFTVRFDILEDNHSDIEVMYHEHGRYRRLRRDDKYYCYDTEVLEGGKTTVGDEIIMESNPYDYKLILISWKKVGRIHLSMNDLRTLPVALLDGYEIPVLDENDFLRLMALQSEQGTARR